MRLKLDAVLLATILALLVVGLLAVWSASSFLAVVQKSGSARYFQHQLVWVATGLVAFVTLAMVNYRRWASEKVVFAGLGASLLACTLAMAVDKRGRFLGYKEVQFQPSEFAKVAVVIYLAWLVTRKRERLERWPGLVTSLVPVGVLCGVIGKEDLGNAAVIAAVTGVGLWLAGVRRKYLAIFFLAGSLAAAMAILSKPYRLKRVVEFIDPHYRLVHTLKLDSTVIPYVSQAKMSRDTRYQADQARISFGAGGLTGRGFLQGTQKFLFLPEPHTDYVYAIVGEELGLLGTGSILCAYFVILWRGLRAAQRAPDPFGSYLALGATAVVVLQALVNMSVVLNLGPTKGIPLPLISYGGSCMWASLANLGLIMSVSARAEPV